MNDVNKIKLSLLNLKKGDKILDIGCSYGEQSMAMAKEGLTVFALDNSEILINKLKKTLKRNKNLNCTPIIGDADKLPFLNDDFDAIVATEVFEHIDNIDQAIKEAYRVLKSGGRACISIPSAITEMIFRKIHPAWVKDSGHRSILTVDRLTAALKKAGFKIERIEKQNFEWSVFWIIHSLLKTRFDHTGAPCGNEEISRRYHKIWYYLFKLKIAPFILKVGNLIMPKSIYLYLVKI